MFRHTMAAQENGLPFFGLDTPHLKDVFAPNCLSCYDYVNAGADLVVGYNGCPLSAPMAGGTQTRSPALLRILVEPELELAPVTSRGVGARAVQQGHRRL